MQSGLELIRGLYHVEITEISSRQDAKNFSSRHLLHPLQIQMTPEALWMIHENQDTNSVYLIHDVLLMYFAAFCLQGHFIILGPYTTLLLSLRDSQQILERSGMKEISPGDVMLYRESYPSLREAEIKNIVRTMIRVLDPDSPVRVFHQPAEPAANAAQEEWDASTILISGDSDRPHYSSLLEKRYAHEQQFIDAIRKGNTRSALLNLDNMQQDVTYLKKIGTTMENERIGAAITRTTVRVAALEAGLPPIIADRLSSENTRRTQSARTVTQILDAKKDMVRNFCQAMRMNLLNSHSALAQSVLYYLEHEYYHPIRLRDIAENLDTSGKKIIRVFSEEFGVTPVAYLNRYRVKKAAELLRTTHLPVGEICGMVGVEDANYFIKLFRREYGKTPTQYRKQNKV